ncbi:DUF4254 domain-containing protein [Nocardia anaemiae]|uniref:DUF4254 domain-containing protein n=1 Tax=Nocardia anaemiae TaxID=263910 RepID=UPI000B198BF4|nr:DUF4254 domain-containing protein [Nocardia anaemiae]
MRTPLPSKDMILQACAGTVTIQHPVLQGAYELASLHEARLDENTDIGAIDRERDRLVSRIDSWVSADQPPAFDAACQHTETVGMVIDRLAQFSVDARVASKQGTSTLEFRYTQHRLTELALGYSDLCFEIAAGTRRLPDFSFPVAEGDSAEPDRKCGP